MAVGDAIAVENSSLIIKADYNIDRICFELSEACLGGDGELIKAIFKEVEAGEKEIKDRLFLAKCKLYLGLIPGVRFKKRDFEVFKLLFDEIDLEDEQVQSILPSPYFLHYALLNNTALFEYLVQTGYSLYKEDSQGLTILNIVCKSGPEWAGNVLLEANIDMNHLNSNGYSSLYYAVKHSNIKMFRELTKHKAEFNGEKSIFLTAVETGNLEIVKFCFNEDKFHPTQEILDKSMSVALENEFILIAKLLIEKGCHISKRFQVIYEAIVCKREATLKFVLHTGSVIDLYSLSNAYFNMNDEDAYVTFPTLLKHCGSLDINLSTEFLYAVIHSNLCKCGYFLIRYLSDNQVCDICELMLSRSTSNNRYTLFEYASIRSEKIFIILSDFLYVNKIDNRSSCNIYHRLIEHKHYKGLKKLLDKSLNYNGNISSKFLGSNEYEGRLPDRDVFPEDSKYSHLKPSFLHKLNNCKDPKVRFHPLINATVAKKLRVYRWWYVLTFVLYCIFLSALYYALFEASYQCDDMLFSYTGSSGAFRAVCEVVVITYAIIFSIDECMEFVAGFIRFSFQQYKTKNILKAISYDRNTNLLQKINNCNALKSHFSPLLRGYFGVFNIVDILGLLFLFLLIIFRLASSPFQWTLASLTIIFFTLRLFKYTRMIPSLGVYVQSIFRVFIKDITQFAVIVTIIILAYFGGIHLAARQTFTYKQTTTPLLYSENCSNNSFTGLFWLDEERTSSYDLRRPLLSGIIFLLDGGPGNEETSLLDSNFLFTLLYLSFAFTIIVVMSNILVAQLSQTYAEINKDSELPFKFDLVVSVEFESNMAFIFGKYLRRSTLQNKLFLHPEEWEEFSIIDPQSEIIVENKENYNRLSTQIDENLKKITETLENHSVKESISELKGDLRYRSDNMDIVLQERLNHLDGLIHERFNHMDIVLQERLNNLDGLIHERFNHMDIVLQERLNNLDGLILKRFNHMNIVLQERLNLTKGSINEILSLMQQLTTIKETKKIYTTL